MTDSGYYPGIYLEGLRRITKMKLRIAGVPAEIRIKHLPNTSPERRRYVKPLCKLLRK
jgi:hypothetical protein